MATKCNIIYYVQKLEQPIHKPINYIQNVIQNYLKKSMGLLYVNRKANCSDNHEHKQFFFNLTSEYVVVVSKK